MQKFLSTIISFLTLVALAVLVLAIYGQYELFYQSTGGTGAQKYSLLPGVAVSTGVLIAALTFLRERQRAYVERQRHISEVLLARVEDGFQTTIKLLSDQNNDRVVWVRAARTLRRAIELKDQIKSEEYQIAYKLAEERARNDLYVVLTVQDPKTKARDPLPPQFFYGIDDWKTTKTLDDAAIKASQVVKAYSVTIDSIPPQPTMRPLAARSVIAIYEFLKYPEDFDDPLGNVPEWGEDWEASHDIDQGARRYVAHTLQKFAVNGKLHARPKADKGEGGDS